MTSEMHSMVKVEVDEDRARLVTEINENEQKFSMQTRLLVNNELNQYFHLSLTFARWEGSYIINGIGCELLNFEFKYPSYVSPI